jgi:hypothetical protein
MNICKPQVGCASSYSLHLLLGCSAPGSEHSGVGCICLTVARGGWRETWVSCAEEHGDCSYLFNKMCSCSQINQIFKHIFKLSQRDIRGWIWQGILAPFSHIHVLSERGTWEWGSILAHLDTWGDGWMCEIVRGQEGSCCPAGVKGGRCTWNVCFLNICAVASGSIFTINSL